MTAPRPKLRIERHGYGHVAECEQCPNLHPDSTRERCRAHAQDTGHTTRYVIEDTTIYRLAQGESDGTTPVS